MKKRIEEEVILFISIIKWVCLASVIGVIVGLSTALFLKILNWSRFFGNHCPYYFFFLPVALFLSAALIKYLAPDAEGHGTEKVIEAVHKHSGKMDPMVVPVKLAATIITLAAGGSVGKEGPCAQIGAGLSSFFADIFRFDDRDRRKLVICGISAGFAAVFGTPIAGAIFGVEVLFVGSILYDVLLPSFVAGMISYHVSSAMGISYFYYAINFVPVFTKSFFIEIVFAGIFFGICSALLIGALKWGESLSHKLKMAKPFKGIIGGVIIIGLVFLFSKEYLGLGLDTISACLHGAKTPWYSFLAKMVFTSITLSFGGSGGIVTPIFFIGATSGVVFAMLFGLDIATFSAVGLVALLAGAANTPIAASIMAVELFGPKIAPYATIACVISFLMTGHRSVYPSQVLAVKKSTSVDVELGREMEGLAIRVDSREKSVVKTFLRIIRILRRKAKP